MEVKNWPAWVECVRFKEKGTDILYDAKRVENGVIVRKLPPLHKDMELITFEQFEERFEESCVPR